MNATITMNAGDAPTCLDLERDITLLLNRREFEMMREPRITAKKTTETMQGQEIEWTGLEYEKRNSDASTLSGLTEFTTECNSGTSSSSVVLLRTIASKSSKSSSNAGSQEKTNRSDSPPSVKPYSRREQTAQSMVVVPEYSQPQYRRHSITAFASPPPPPPPPRKTDDGMTVGRVNRRGSLDSNMCHMKRLPIEIELQGNESFSWDETSPTMVAEHEYVPLPYRRRCSMPAVSCLPPPPPPPPPPQSQYHHNQGTQHMARRCGLDSGMGLLKRLPSMDMDRHGDEMRAMFVSQDTLMAPSLYEESEIDDDDDDDEGDLESVTTDCRFVRELYLEDPNGERGEYTGEICYATGRPHGEGRMNYDDEGKWYDGDWVYGLWDGHGQCSNRRGDVYQGRFVKGCKHGRGTTKYADGRVFEGIYKKDKMLRGKMTYIDGSNYHGEWRHGQRHGHGKYMFDARGNNWYEGEFRDDLFHGIGRMQWADGGFYFGQWMNGEMHGDGQEVLADGTLRHDGAFRQGQPVRICPKVRRSSIIR
jgi:hypothetical protein